MTRGANSDTALDGALDAWAKTDPLSGAGDDAALLRILVHADAIATPDHARRHTPWRMAGAVAVAASAALLVVLSPGVPRTGDSPEPQASVTLAQAHTDESAAFALLYTPSSEEEYQL